MPQCFNWTSQPSWTLLYTQDHSSSLPQLVHHSLHPVSVTHNLCFTLSPVVYLKYKSFLLCSKAYLQNKSKFLYWTQLYHLHSFIFHHTSSTLSHTLWPLHKHAIWITTPKLWAHYSLFLECLPHLGAVWYTMTLSQLKILPSAKPSPGKQMSPSLRSQGQLLSIQR